MKIIILVLIYVSWTCSDIFEIGYPLTDYPCQAELDCNDTLPVCPDGYYYKLNLSKCFCYDCHPCPETQNELIPMCDLIYALKEDDNNT